MPFLKDSKACLSAGMQLLPSLPIKKKVVHMARRTNEELVVVCMLIDGRNLQNILAVKPVLILVFIYTNYDENL